VEFFGFGFGFVGNDTHGERERTTLSQHPIGGFRQSETQFGPILGGDFSPKTNNVAERDQRLSDNTNPEPNTAGNCDKK
jgi:hypothetical protein